MAKTLEDYQQYLPVVPARLPGLYRWRLHYDGVAGTKYPYIVLDVWKPRIRGIFKRYEDGGDWHAYMKEMLYSQWEGRDLARSANLILTRALVHHSDSNTVMAERK